MTDTIPDGADSPRDDAPKSSPYGPQPDNIDQSSGGADSSPFETLSSDERRKLLADDDEDAAEPF